MRRKPILIALLTLLAGSSLMFAGTVSGKVTYTGTPAHQKAIDMSKEPSCAKQHATPISTETVVTGANNALENVVVYISAGAPDEGQVPTQAITYTQKGCQYLPHVLPMHVNQEFEILNDDQTSHNIHPVSYTHLVTRNESESSLPIWTPSNSHSRMRGRIQTLSRTRCFKRLGFKSCLACFPTPCSDATSQNNLHTRKRLLSDS